MDKKFKMINQTKIFTDSSSLNDSVVWELKCAKNFFLFTCTHGLHKFTQSPSESLE